jgi:hypothetical protein
VLSTGLLNAATQGDLATGDNTISSTGDVDITLTIPHVIDIDRLDDIVFGVVDLSVAGNKVQDEQFCVRSNDATGYDITFDSVVPGSFALEGLTTSSLLPYTVQFATVDPVATVGTYAAVTAGVAILNVTEQRSRPDCAISGTPADNASVRITVAENDLVDQQAEDFSDTLVIVVSPN